MVLAATYAHLGRQKEAEAAVASLNAVRIEQGGIPMTIPVIRSMRPADMQRLVEGLQQAGVPASVNALFGGDFGSQNRLTADEIRSLILGQELGGLNFVTFVTGGEHHASVKPDGTAAMSGDWGYIADGTVRFAGDQLCFDTIPGVGDCGGVFRNPGGTQARRNEFIWYTTRGAFTFSQLP
jgi:hypothetical protein